jgi:anaerobic selenocysteine-containing dehydrogenase
MRLEMSSTTRRTYCRLCHCACPIDADIEHGRVVRVRGVRDNDLFHGYTCSKGRAYPAMHADPGRLLHSRKRQADGSHAAIPVEQAMDEIAERLAGIAAEHGPRSVALYLGTQCAAHPATGALASAWLAALGSKMYFTPITIDQPGKFVAQAMHGVWRAPAQNFDRPEALVIVGANPLVANHMGLPCSHPGRWLKDQRARGCQLVVIDPRRTETARRADLHLQVRPGCDAIVLAAMLRILFEEDLVDHAFMTEEVEGVDALCTAVAPFVADRVAEIAGITTQDLERAARIWGRAARGYAVAGTGPNMNGPGATLIEYLALCLTTVCGRWLRDGDRVLNPGALGMPLSYKAQANPRRPAYDFGVALRARGLRDSTAGLPTAALAEEMILEGEGQVRALVSVGGNPVNAWPDQLRTLEALEAAELVVQIDAKMSETARRADYVIATRMPFEMPGMTLLVDNQSTLQLGYGFPRPWAAVAPALVDPPAGSELIEDWELFYGLAQRMDLGLAIGNKQGIQPLDMHRKPTSEQLFRAMTEGSRIPFDEVAAVEGGAVFDGEPVYVAPKDPGCETRLDVGNAELMADLGALADRTIGGLAEARSGALARGSGEASIGMPTNSPPRAFRLISRRTAEVYNSTGVELAGRVTGRSFNPAFMCPEDADALGLAPGDEIALLSDHGRIPAILEIDRHLRPGLVSMAHGWGGAPDRDAEVRSLGGNTNRLASTDAAWDRYTGIPVMSNLPVDVIAPGDLSG